MRGETLHERRRAHRHAATGYYEGFTDRRQPAGTVATWVRVTGGELVRGRVHYTHWGRVLAAKLRAMGTQEWEGEPCDAS